MFYLEDNLFKEHYLENNGDKLSFKVFPEVSLPMERNLSRERIRQGPVFPRHTAARNMRSTKKSNTFLYRYSTFLHTTLTTIHGTTFHLNDTIKIAHFSFLFFFLSRLSSRISPLSILFSSLISRRGDLSSILRQKKKWMQVSELSYD